MACAWAECFLVEAAFLRTVEPLDFLDFAAAFLPLAACFLAAVLEAAAFFAGAGWAVAGSVAGAAAGSGATGEACAAAAAGVSSAAKAGVKVETAKAPVSNRVVINFMLQDTIERSNHSALRRPERKRGFLKTPYLVCNPLEGRNIQGLSNNP